MQLAIKEETIQRLDEIANTYQLARVDKSPFSASLSTAVAINSLRSLLTPDVMKPLMALMNSPIGFLTDRTGRPNWKGEVKPLYTEETIKDVIIEATLRGFFPVGNEFNVIADRFYAAKAGLRRKVSTHPGLTEFRDSYGVPKIQGEAGALVEARATWKLNGQPDELTRTFAVKGDKYAGADSYTGKATRKLLAAVLERISGVSVPEGEAEEADIDGMKSAHGREVNYDDAYERAMEQWRIDCKGIEEYNARLRAQGAPEEDMEPMPPRPEPSDDDEIPGLEKQAEKPAPEIPWQDVVVSHFKSLNGKKLGELGLPMLEKIRETINGLSVSVRASKPGINDLLSAVCKGIKEIAPVEEPKKATPLEGLRNLMASSGITEKAVLAYILEQQGSSPGAFANLRPEMASALITAWPDIVDQIKALSK